MEPDTGGGVRFRASCALRLHLETAWRPGALAGYVDTSAYLLDIAGAADGVTLYEGEGTAGISREPGKPERSALAVDARVHEGRHVFVVETVVEFEGPGAGGCAVVPVFRCSFAM